MGQSMPQEEIPESLVVICMYCGRYLNDEGSLGQQHNACDTLLGDRRIYYGKCQECLKEHSPALYSYLYEEENYSYIKNHSSILH